MRLCIEKICVLLRFGDGVFWISWKGELRMLICISIVRCSRLGNPKLNIQIALLFIACESILILFEFRAITICPETAKKLAMIIKAKMC